MASEQRYVRGLFAGGTLAIEAMALFEEEGFRILSNVQKEPGRALQSPHRSEGHAIVDLGDDVFTLGRPHPMIDPSLRETKGLPKKRLIRRPPLCCWTLFWVMVPTRTRAGLLQRA